jgi:hypothetical protein
MNYNLLMIQIGIEENNNSPKNLLISAELN